MNKRTKSTIQGIVILIMLLVCINITGAATYYVNMKSSNCKDSYTKTQAQSLSTPWCTFTEGLSNVGSGDTLYVLNGTYTNSEGYSYQNKDLTAPTKIKAYTGANPVLTSAISDFSKIPNTKWTKISSGLWSASYSSSVDDDYWTTRYAKTGESLFTHKSLTDVKNTALPEGIFFDNPNNKLFLRLDDTSANPNTISFLISNSYVLYIDRIIGDGLEISGFTVEDGSRGIYVLDSTNIDIINNKIKGGLMGIEVKRSEDITVRNNKVSLIQGDDWTWNNVKGSPMETSGIFLQDDLAGLNINNNEVTGYFNGILMFSSGSGASSMFSGILVYKNKIHDIMDDALELEEYCNGGKFYNNTMYDVFVGISLSPLDSSKSQSSIYNNIIIADKTIRIDGTDNTGECYKIISDDGIQNLNIHHNTCIGRGVYSPEEYTRNQRNIIWKDNIFYSVNQKLLDKSGLSADGVSFNYNLYWRTDGSIIFSYWNSDTNSAQFTTLADAKDSSLWNEKWDVNSKQANPQFTDISEINLKPKSGSPACTMSSTGSYVGAVPCTSSPPAAVCGDKACNGKENCSTCSGDCGSCPSTNRVPTQSKPLLRASDYPDNSSLADLNCYNQSTRDADGNKVVNKYRWFRNGTYMSAFNNKTMVDVTNTLRFQTWICEVTPNDGKVYGTPMNSSPLYIRAPPASSVCGDKICNGKENCSTCAGDCGTCPATNTKITGCVLEDVAWNENAALKRVYDLSSCFKDPLKTTLTYSVRGNKQIKVTITSGQVDLSSPTDWTGVEHVVFVATSGSRSASTNNITLTVNHVAVCGNDVCEDDLGETCTSCSSDCGECPAKKSSGGGGGGGGSSYTPTTSITDDESNETENETAGTPSVIITDNSGSDGNMIPPLISGPEPAQEPALTEGSSNLETATGLGFEEPSQETANAVSELINSPSNSPSPSNNLVPIVFVTLALVLVAPGVYLISKNHEQLLAKLKKVHRVILYEEDISSKDSISVYFNKLRGFVLLAISKGKDSINQLLAKFKKSNKIVYFEDDASEKIPHDYFARLHELVSKAISRGHDKLLVASKLRDSGWSEEIIEGVLDKHNKEFVIKTLESSGLDAKHADALHTYVRKAMEKGHGWANIAKDLLRVGWTSKVVDCLLKTYCDTSLSFLPSFHPSGLEEKIE